MRRSPGFEASPAEMGGSARPRQRPHTPGIERVAVRPPGHAAGPVAQQQQMAAYRPQPRPLAPAAMMLPTLFGAMPAGSPRSATQEQSEL